MPKLFPKASPRLVVRIGFLAMFAALVVMLALLDISAGPEIVTWPMLLAGLGIGALASQLGAVTVSSVPDERTGEVGGLQNTGDKPRRVDRDGAGRRGPDLRAHVVVLREHRRQPRRA